ncbi:MAG: energy transducer TonB [Nitrospiraceae bacterium]|nr:MAG: energy transducer TonB [Nitrospiraceae bacterium]
MTIKRFIALSIIIHAGIFIGLYFLPESSKKKPSEFLASLISPEELRKPEIRTVPLPPAVPQKKEPLRMPRKAPVPQPSPKHVPSPETPLVPGMGNETGKPLPKDVSPQPGGGDKGGEGGAKKPTDRDTLKGQRQNSKPGYSMREKLYDPGVIGDIAMKGGGDKPKKDDSITFDTSDYRYAGYMRKLKSKIESIWVYPPEALARGLYGDLKIRFTIRKDGKLGAIELVRTSGYKMLDDAAMRALKDGEPYWPLPDEWGMESYTILGHFVYSLYGYSLR